MRSVTVQEAETNIKELLREVEAGEQIEIRRGDTPIALISAQPKTNPLAALKGRFEGQIVIHGDFNDYDEQIARDFGVHDD